MAERVERNGGVRGARRTAQSAVRRPPLRIPFAMKLHRNKNKPNKQTVVISLETVRPTCTTRTRFLIGLYIGQNDLACKIHCYVFIIHVAVIDDPFLLVYTTTKCPLALATHLEAPTADRNEGMNNAKVRLAFSFDFRGGACTSIRTATRGSTRPVYPLGVHLCQPDQTSANP